MMMYPAMGWKGSADALFSFETKYSSEAHCLKAAHEVSSSQFAVAPSTVLVLNLPIPLVWVFIMPALAAASSPLKDTVLTCFDKESLRQFVLHQGLQTLKMSHLQLVRKQISYPMRKCQDLNAFIVKEAEKGKLISFYLSDVPGRFAQL